LKRGGVAFYFNRWISLTTHLQNKKIPAKITTGIYHGKGLSEICEMIWINPRTY